MQVTQEEIRDWARAFCASLAVGRVKSLVQHLDESMAGITNTALRSALMAGRRELESGYSLSRTLAKHPEVFDADFITVVRYGEIYGEVDRTLERFAERLEDMFPPCTIR